MAVLKEQYPPSTTYHINSSVMNSLKDHIKCLESEIQFLRKEIKEKNKANTLQNSNSRTNFLQERGTESTASGNGLGKNVKEVFVEKTKVTDNVKPTSLSHSTEQDDSNSNISNS